MSLSLEAEADARCCTGRGSLDLDSEDGGMCATSGASFL